MDGAQAFQRREAALRDLADGALKLHFKPRVAA